MRARLRLLLILTALPLCGCVDHNAWTVVDTWFTSQLSCHPEYPWINIPWKELPRELFQAVVLAREEEAENLLENVTFLEISSEQLFLFTGNAISAPAGRRPFLVRGVYLNEYGAFRMSISGDLLLVHHGCMGRQAVPMKRRCLVVLLERPPRQAYVTCDMVE
jgi:hypothetical protein